MSDRQIEVLSLAAQGKSNLAIAKQLGIAEGTVKLHMSAIFKALNVQNRSEAVLLASRLQSVNFRQVKEAEGGAMDLDWLLPHMTHRRLPRDTIVFRKGDAGEELLYLQLQFSCFRAIPWVVPNHRLYIYRCIQVTLASVLFSRVSHFYITPRLHSLPHRSHNP